MKIVKKLIPGSTVLHEATAIQYTVIEIIVKVRKVNECVK